MSGDNIVATLYVTEVDALTVRVCGTILHDDGNMRDVDYEAPRLMFSALLAIAEKEGALS